VPVDEVVRRTIENRYNTDEVLYFRALGDATLRALHIALEAEVDVGGEGWLSSAEGWLDAFGLGAVDEEGEGEGESGETSGAQGDNEDDSDGSEYGSVDGVGAGAGESQEGGGTEDTDYGRVDASHQVDRQGHSLCQVSGSRSTKIITTSLTFPVSAYGIPRHGQMSLPRLSPLIPPLYAAIQPPLAQCRVWK